MPLRAEHRHLYGRAWKAFRLQLIELHRPVCSVCGIWMQAGINGAHLDHDPRNNASVVLMCPRCHARHDSGHRIAIMRRRKAAAADQLWLLPELEWAPFASWEIPGWIYDRMIQLRLFDGE
jgi:hypothetical protein